jgi:hemerythrin
MFEWTEDYTTGIGSIDAQHRCLFAIASELHAAMSVGSGRASTGKILARLVLYVTTHFSHEERLMRQYDYPEFAAHKALHEELKEEVMRFQSDFQQGGGVITVQLLRFLRDWLDRHIKVEDRKYVACMTGVLVA